MFYPIVIKTPPKLTVGRNEDVSAKRYLSRRKKILVAEKGISTPSRQVTAGHQIS